MEEWADASVRREPDKDLEEHLAEYHAQSGVGSARAHGVAWYCSFSLEACQGEGKAGSRGTADEKG